MAVSSPTMLTAFASNEEFRAWAQAIHDALIAVGMVQTADTGQVDLTTVNKPGTANNSAGYRIYRFSDALQATAPVFIKIEFGTGADASRPSLWTTVGNNTNGAGTLTGQVSTRVQSAPSATPATGLCRFSGATNRLMMNLYFAEANGRSMILCVERSHDANGDDNGTAALILQSTTVGGARTSSLPLAGGALFTTTNKYIYSAQPVDDTTGGVGPDVVIYPAHFPARHSRGPAKNAVVYAEADFPSDTAFSVDPYGGANNITYRGSGPGGSFQPSAAWRVAYRYD